MTKHATPLTKPITVARCKVLIETHCGCWLQVKTGVRKSMSDKKPDPGLVADAYGKTNLIDALAE